MLSYPNTSRDSEIFQSTGLRVSSIPGRNHPSVGSSHFPTNKGHLWPRGRDNCDWSLLHQPHLWDHVFQTPDAWFPCLCMGTLGTQDCHNMDIIEKVISWVLHQNWKHRASVKCGCQKHLDGEGKLELNWKSWSMPDIDALETTDASDYFSTTETEHHARRSWCLGQNTGNSLGGLRASLMPRHWCNAYVRSVGSSYGNGLISFS